MSTVMSAPSQPTPAQNVLFLCTGNSARSILAEAILNRMAREKYRSKFIAHSAGSKPLGTVNPHALSLLQKLDYDTAFARSKSWDEFAGSDTTPLDIVITVCDNAAGETCPLWPGTPLRAHWGLPDPASLTGTDAQMQAAFMQTYTALQTRIAAFLKLPHASTERAKLQSMLDTIGHQS